MSLPNGEPTRRQMIEIDVGILSSPGKKPETFLELCDMVWKAFELGKQWQIEKDKEEP